ncbi:MAG: hypothetical protein M1820_002529 [Bogoriella megaspora]|nr:MAG: hypothetical protein M1820_002529 [Bogoriella megaspora]
MESFELFTSIRVDSQLQQSSANSELQLNSNVKHSNLYMIRFHRDRILSAAEHFGWDSAQQTLKDEDTFLKSINAYIEQHNPEDSRPLRLKILLSKSGTLDFTSSPTPPVPLSQLFPSTLDLPQHRPEAKPLKTSPLTGGALTLGPGTYIPPSHPLSPPWPIHISPHPITPSPFTSYKTTQRNIYDTARRDCGISDLATEAEVLLVNDRGEVMEGSMTSVYFFRGGRWVTPPGESGGQRGTTRRWALERGLCVEEVVRRRDVEEGEEVWVSSGVRGFRRGVVRLGKDGSQ